jgi:hypothetical protein
LEANRDTTSPHPENYYVGVEPNPPA